MLLPNTDHLLKINKSFFSVSNNSCETIVVKIKNLAFDFNTFYIEKPPIYIAERVIDTSLNEYVIICVILRLKVLDNIYECACVRVELTTEIYENGKRNFIPKTRIQSQHTFTHFYRYIRRSLKVLTRVRSLL